jgi:hypothetical protein
MARIALGESYGHKRDKYCSIKNKNNKILFIIKKMVADHSILVIRGEPNYPHFS